MIKEFDFEQIAVAEAVNVILYDGTMMAASNIFIESDDNGLKVNFLINNELIRYTHIPHCVKDNVIRRIKIMTGLNIFNTSKKESKMLYCNFNRTKPEKYVDFDITYIPDIDNEKLEISVMPK